MNFNKEQREGLARVCDTLAVTAIIGAVVGATGHSPLQAVEIGVLIAISPVLLAVGYFFRRQK
jgi:hypothetical protein